MKNTGTLKVTTPSDREIVLTRVFDAPRHLVFDALTRPELLNRWFGPRGWSLSVCEGDLKVNGAWRRVLRGPDGTEMGMRGVFREIVPPDRLVYTEAFDDFPGESLVTTVLVEHRGRTTMTTTILYPSQEVRDAVISSGMEHGAAECYDRVEDLMRDVAIAREVQARLLPRTQPSLQTLDYRGRCLQAHGIGGDYYDFFDLDPGKVGFVLSDVSGKGVPAALLMASLQASLRSQRSVALEDLPRLLRSVNRLFWEATESHLFATVFFGVYDDATRRLRYESCGHNPPLIFRPDGGIERLEGTATVMGMFEQWDCSEAEIELRPGDHMVMYSDGITEATSSLGELYGEARLLEVTRANRQRPVDELLEAILDDVVRFSGPMQSDDLTLIVGRCK